MERGKGDGGRDREKGDEEGDNLRWGEEQTKGDGERSKRNEKDGCERDGEGRRKRQKQKQRQTKKPRQT